MFNWIIRASLRYRAAVIAIYVGMMLAALALVPRMSLDVFPEFAPPQIQIQTEAPGFPSEDVERLITRPLESTLQGMPLVDQMRSYSTVGLSRIVIVFDPSIDVYDARMLAQERLQLAQAMLPTGVGAPQMMPMTSAVSWLQKFALIDWSANPDPLELRSLVDWDFRIALMAQPGVAEVVASGGGVKQYQVLIDPIRMRMADVSIDDVINAASDANLIQPGAYLHPSRDQEYFLRVDGQVHTIEDIQRTLITMRNGVPLTIADVATVVEGHEIKRGDGQTMDGNAVIGTVSKLWGADTLDTTHAVQETLDQLALSLPDHIQLISNVFRQASSIERSIDNLQTALIEAIVVVALLLLLLIGRWRPTVISLIAIPTSLTMGMLILWALGIGINALTLGGLIFAVGEVVDDAVIDVENILRRYREAQAEGEGANLLQIVFEGSAEIRNSVVFATAIVVLAFVPIFFLSEIEGRMFTPLAIAYIAAVSGSLLVALSLIPVLTYFALRRGAGDAQLSPVARWLGRQYRRILHPVINMGWWAVLISVVGTLLAVILLATADSRFLPQQGEGNVVIATTAMPGTSLEENMRMGKDVMRIVSDIPGVISIVQRAGRSRMDEDAQPVNFSEFDVTLDPRARNAGEIMQRMRDELAVLPGVATDVSQFITHRMQEILSGVRAQVVIKIFGSDLNELERLQGEVLHAVSHIEGITDLQPEPLIAIPGYNIRVDRPAAALYGLTPGEIVRQAGAVLNGLAVSRVIEGDRSFDLVVRSIESARDDIETISQLPLRTSTGALVPLSAVASLAPTQDRYQVARDDGQRRAVVQWNVPGGNLGEVVAAAQAAIDEAVILPPGFRLEIGGDYVGQKRATQNLLWSGTLSLMGIMLLLSLAFRSGWMAVLVALNIPFALFGGALVLRLGGGGLDVASIVGLIALAGVSARNGILLLNRYEMLELEKAGSAVEIAMRGAADRLLPILMTALTTALAVIPLILGDPVGKEYQRAVALVLLGGMMSSLILNLLLIPPLYVALRRRVPMLQHDSAVQVQGAIIR